MPQTVVFYGISYRRHWFDIAQVALTDTGKGSWFGQDDQTSYLVISHPNARGLDTGHFVEQGRLWGDGQERVRRQTKAVPSRLCGN